VDLGSGGGIDVFLAADKAGPTGQIIGIDMSSVSPSHFCESKIVHLEIKIFRT
jgi:ubiquinone/menaquinone biosynthesis C-methylase UbiE